jgi:type IV pilus biogenesis protein CpaD/CtpE
MIHRHVWTVVTRDTLPSTMDKLIAADVKFIGAADAAAIDCTPIVVKARCAKCGAEKVYRL